MGMGPLLGAQGAIIPAPFTAHHFWIFWENHLPPFFPVSTHPILIESTPLVPSYFRSPCRPSPYGVMIKSCPSLSPPRSCTSCSLPVTVNPCLFCLWYFSLSQQHLNFIFHQITRLVRVQLLIKARLKKPPFSSAYSKTQQWDFSFCNFHISSWGLFFSI